MSKVNRTFIGVGGQWLNPKKRFYGKDGQWLTCLSKMVGHKGRWVEVFNGDSESSDPGFGIDSVSYRYGLNLQGNLAIRGPGIRPFRVPEPSDYAYYPLKQNTGEYKQNFSNLLLNSDSEPSVAPSVLLDEGLALHSTDKQYAQFAAPDDGGLDQYGVLGAFGSRYWLLGLQFNLTALPSQGSRVVLLSVGLASRKRVSLSVNSFGDLMLSWEGDITKEVSLPESVIPGVPMGVWVEHNDGQVRIKNSLGEEALMSAPPYFIPPTGEDGAIVIGKGVCDVAEAPVEEYINHDVTAANLTIIDPFTVSNATNQYLSAAPGGVIHPGTGKYYIEVHNNDTYDMHIGLVPVGASLTLPTGVVGWAMNTINGRKFAQQTGGGTDWGNPAVPANSTIGVLYDSDAGSVEYFVNGVSRGVPFAAGTITEPVTFGFSLRGNTTQSIVSVVNVERTPATVPAGANYFPLDTVVTDTETVYVDGVISNVFLRNEPYTSDTIQDDLIAPNFRISTVWENKETGQTTDAIEYKLKVTEGDYITYVPDLPEGAYDVRVLKNGNFSNSQRMYVKNFSAATEAIDIDFGRATLREIDRVFLVAHKQWGGLNGGVISENVWLDEQNGELVCRACGDEYTGALRGVDQFGERTDVATRIGGCFLTDGYYGPGSYEVVAKLPYKDGVVSAFWTFHYEEGYPGTPLYDEHIADGIHVSGSEEDGFYTVRNHEIDIEIPTALKGAQDMEVVSYSAGRFNTWRGELRNWDVDESDPDYWTEYTDMFTDFGFAVNDGEFHKFRFDWYLDDDPRVEFYIDDILVEVVRETIPDIPGRFWIGLWFPSAPGNHWAGKSADFDEEYMKVKSVKITPFLDQYPNLRNRSETYPNDVFRRFIESAPG